MTSPSTAGAASGASQRPLYATLARRIATSVALIVLLAIPAGVLFAVTGEAAALQAITAGIAGVVAVAVGGLEVGLMTAFVMALITPVSIVAGGVPITGAALMALMCLTVGRLSRFGLQGATLLVPIFMSWMLIDPPTWGPAQVVDRMDSTYLAWLAAIYFIGAVVPVIVLYFPLRKLNLPVPKPHPRRESIPYTVTITVLATASTFFVLLHPQQYAGAFLIATILVLAQIGENGTVRRTVQRVVGTLIGSVVVAVIVLQVDSLTAIYVIGLIGAVAAITARFSPHYWLYMALITPTAVCLNSYSTSQVSQVGEQRVVDTLVGAAMVLIAAGLTVAYSRWDEQHDRPPTRTAPVILGHPAATAA